MSFNSLYFVLFLLTVCILARFVKGKKKIILLIANIVFYCSNSVYNCCLLFSIIAVTYILGLLIEKKKQRWLLITGIVILFTPLILYKYLNFFIGTIGISSIKIFSILPLGISFYTFQAVGYLIDVYKYRIKAESNIVNLSFFL